MSDPTQPQVLDVSALPTLEEFIASRSGAGPSTASRLYRAVAQPVTRAVSGAAGAILDTASLAGPMAGVPEGATTASQNMAPFTETIGQMVVPQTPTDAAILAATGGTGALASKVGLTGLKAAGTRLAGSTLGGAMGGFAEDPSSPMGAAVGAATGLLTGGIGEIIGGLTNFGRQVGIDRVRSAMQISDAKGVGQALEQNTKLGRVFAGLRTPEQLRELALGTTTLPNGKIGNTGILKLGAEQDQAQSAIEALIAARRPASPPNAATAPNWPAALNTFQGQSKGWFPDPQNPKNFVPFEEWRKSFSELGTKAFGGPKGNPLEPTINGVDTRQRWAEAAREVRQYLTNYDPSGKAVALFNGAQEQYEAGRAVLKALRLSFQGMRPNEIAFNSNVLQAVLGRQQVKLTKALGQDGYDALVTAANHGTPLGPGYQDAYAPGGVLSRLSEIVPGPGGTYGRFKLGEPSLVGNPLQLSQGQRTGLTLGTQAAGLPLMNQTGLPLMPGLPPVTLAPGQGQP